jgi:pyridoxamine 5'-phosphate oxidase
VIGHFEALLTRARAEAPRTGGADATAFVLATAAGGRPSARYVLLKEADAEGLVFFTSYRSRKGRELHVNPRAAACFSWPWIGVEIRAEGPVERVTATESDAYFASRSRGKRLGAWASRQSEPLRTPVVLILRWLAFALRFLGRRVPRPAFWGGFRIRLQSVEFRQDAGHGVIEHRLYRRHGEAWRLTTTFGPS